MKRIDEDIKNHSLRKVYLLYGEEDYLKRQYKEKILREALSEGDTMNLAIYEGKNPPQGEIIDLAETMPFFSERRVILLENSGLFKEAAGLLSDYLKSIPETTCFIFLESEIDKRSKIYKTVGKEGLAVEFAAQTEKTLMLWVAGKLKKEGLQIRESTLHYFLDQCGNDMNTLYRELEKLVSYCQGRDSVENQDIDAICSVQINNEIFSMLDDMSSGRKSMALKRYYDLLSLKEPPMRILFLISRQFRIYDTMKKMDGRYSNDEIAKTCGIPPFSLRKYRTGMSRYSLDTLQQALEDCAELERAVKIGNLNDQMSVELLLSKYCV